MTAESLISGIVTPVRGDATLSVRGKSVTWSKVAELAEKTRALLSEAGVGPGDRVVIASASELDVATLYLGCLGAGVTAVVLDPASSAAEFTVLVQHSDPRLILADGELVDRASAVSTSDHARTIRIEPAASRRKGFALFRPRAKAAAETEMSFPALLDSVGEAPAIAAPGPGDTALILFTSGTTSRPKGVEITFGNLAAQMRTMARQYGIEAGSRIINHLPFHHTDGLNQGPLLAIQAGASLVRPEPVTLGTVDVLLDRVFQERPTHLVTVPTVLSMALRLPDSYNDSFSGAQGCAVLSTAGKLNDGQWRDFEDRFGVLVVNSYGLTETCSEALYSGPDPDTRRIGTIGKPVDCEAMIADPETGDATDGRAGELLVRGANIMRGYFRDDEATAAAFRGDWLRTGDLAERNEDGFYRIVGRLKNVIIRGGTNVYPDDVAAALLAVPGVNEASVIGIPDEMMGERVIGCISAEGQSDEAAAGVLEQLRGMLSREKLPDRIIAFDGLPYGPSGKVALPQLRQMVEARLDAEQDAGIMLTVASALGVQAAELSTDMILAEDPRIDSLRFLELIMSIERRYAIEFSPRETMGARTLGDLVGLVENKTGQAK